MPDQVSPAQIRRELMQSLLDASALDMVFTKLLYIATGPQSSAKDKIAAAKVIIDFVFGKSPQTLEMIVTPTGGAIPAVANLTQEQLQANLIQAAQHINQGAAPQEEPNG